MTAPTRRRRRLVPRVGRWATSRPAPDPRAVAGENPVHRVILRRFFMGRYPVTGAQWRVYYAAVDADTRQTLDPRSVEGAANHPVVWVSWHDALGYCRWLTRTLRARAGEAAASLATRTVPPGLAAVLLHGDEDSGGRPWVVT